MDHSTDGTMYTHSSSSPAGLQSLIAGARAQGTLARHRIIPIPTVGIGHQTSPIPTVGITEQETAS